MTVFDVSGLALEGPGLKTRPGNLKVLILKSDSSRGCPNPTPSSSLSHPYRGFPLIRIWCVWAAAGLIEGVPKPHPLELPLPPLSRRQPGGKAPGEGERRRGRPATKEPHCRPSLPEGAKRAPEGHPTRNLNLCLGGMFSPSSPKLSWANLFTSKS